MDCRLWLEKYMHDNDGFVLSDIVRAAAKEHGFSKAELKTARKSLGIKTFHQFDEYGATVNWFWYLEESR